MLQQLHIENFTLIDQLDLDLRQGLTVITGETGAGKSIIIDALSLVLGQRAEAGIVPNEAEKSVIVADFDVSKSASARKWLQDNDLDEEDQCLLKRIITRDGRSRATINGQPVTLNMLKSFTEHVVDIHSQHAHHALLKDKYQLGLLDQFANHAQLVSQVAELHQQLSQLNHQIHAIESESRERTDRKNLLSYQLQELDQFGLTETEASSLNDEHSRLSHSQELQQTVQNISHQMDDTEFDGTSAKNTIDKAIAQLSDKVSLDQRLSPLLEQLQSISIDLQEFCSELNAYSNHLEIDPEKLQQLEQRLSQWHDLARKHRIEPEQLCHHHQQLADEFKSLSEGEANLEELKQQLLEIKEHFFQKASQLSNSRKNAAESLQQQVVVQLQKLQMQDCYFQVEFEPLEHPAKEGLEKIQFMFQPNAGMEPQPLSKIASGGELSRVSLAIQVITRSQSSIPVVIFDEVDVGIGGATAAIVGQLLRTLSEKVQILCITHQPQVASQGMQHLLVSKQNKSGKTHTSINELTKDQRVQEIARMLGGLEITSKTRTHAEEMLSL